MSLTATRPSRLPPVQTRSRGPRIVLLSVAVAGLALLAVTQLAAARRHLLLARSDLSSSRQALARRDDAGATAALDRATRNLKSTQSVASSLPLKVLRVVPLLGSPVRASTAATRAGLEGVAAGRILVAATASFPTSASAAVDGQDLSAFHAAATRSVGAVDDADRHLAAASAALAGPAGAWLPPVSAPARAMRAEVERSRRELGRAANGLSLLEDLSGPSTSARLLLLSQDSLELRPTGGYIGSYGVLGFDRGKVKLAQYAATEDLPAPNPPVKPPEGLAPYLPSYWALTNVNWWPDFPTTAAAAAEMYRRQGGGNVDGVLALTEAATARLVGVVGPLRLPSYPQPVVEAGFDERVVHEVELKRPLDNPRKKFLVELSDVLFERIFDLPAGQLPGVATAVSRSIGAGDIQLWFKDPARQARLAGTAVAGALPHTDGDFLMVVDANLGASKANLDLTKAITYRVDRDDQGRRVGHVRIEVRNEGPKTGINPFYNSYLRVYAPEGSQLLHPGPLQAQQKAADGPYVVFIQPLIVQPETTEYVIFDYLLPSRLAHDRYRLTWPRQPGTTRDLLSVTVDGRHAESDATLRRLNFTR